VLLHAPSTPERGGTIPCAGASTAAVADGPQQGMGEPQHATVTLDQAGVDVYLLPPESV